MPRARSPKPSTVIVAEPPPFVLPEGVWRELADETWTVIPDAMRRTLEGRLEPRVPKVISSQSILTFTAQQWLARLAISNEDLAVRLARSDEARAAVVTRLADTVGEWLRAATQLRGHDRLSGLLIDSTSRLLLSSALPQLARLGDQSEQSPPAAFPSPAEFPALEQMMLALTERPGVIEGVMSLAMRPLEREFYRLEYTRLLDQVWLWLNAALLGDQPIGVLGNPVQKNLAEAVEAVQVIHTYSGQAMQTVDRAVRGGAGRGWLFPDYDAPLFHDDNNQHKVRYQDDNLTVEKLKAEVQLLEPRTADVLRLIMARSLETWQDGQVEPPAVWVDARELCQMMGYHKAKHGGFKTEHIAVVTKALVDLERLWIEVPKGTAQYPLDPKSKKRTMTTLEANRSYRVFSVTGKDELRDLFGNRYPLRWQIRPGDWIGWYPRQFAPLLAKIVELPATGAVNVWAKALGTELTYQYRQDRNRSPDKTLTVERLLHRAVLLSEVHDWARHRNAGRGRKYFDQAMDELQRLGVCARWQYHAEDYDAIERLGVRSRFEAWIGARVIITAPAWLLQKLPELEATLPLSTTKAAKRASRKSRATEAD